MEIDLTSGYITEVVARRSGDLHIENFMRPSARLLICAMWPPEAHEFDISDLTDLNWNSLFLLSYRVIFLPQLEAPFLDFYEDFWWHRIESLINIQPMITPTI